MVASLTRWGVTASPGKAVFKNVESVDAKGPLTVEIRLKDPSGSLLTNLAQVDSAAVIYAREIIDASAGGQLTEHVGTGPYRFVEHKPDRHIKLARFDGYASRSEPVRWIVTTEYEHHDKPELWDAFSTAFVFVPAPSTSSQANCDWPGWWCNPEKDQLLQAMQKELDGTKRLALWEKVQTVFYADAARIKFGDDFRLDARRKDVAGRGTSPDRTCTSGTCGWRSGSGAHGRGREDAPTASRLLASPPGLQPEGGRAHVEAVFEGGRAAVLSRRGARFERLCHDETRRCVREQQPDDRLPLVLWSAKR